MPASRTPTKKFVSPWRLIAEFVRLETSAGLLLFAAAILAIIISNSPLQNLFLNFFHNTIQFQLAQTKISFSLIDVINEFFMAIFFLLVGLEIKREIVVGQLNSLEKIGLPACAALGGMLVPALIFALFNWQDEQAMRGWAIPTATDIAFALGVLALLGRKIPLSIKLFLMALAIFDDLGGILIIAIFYKTQLSIPAFGGILLCLVGLFILNKSKVQHLTPFLIIGLIMWYFFLKSGIHPTLSGVVLAATIPLSKNKTALNSPLRRLEHHLHPYVAFIILPLFSLANAGVSFGGLAFNELFTPLSLGIMLGLFLGKQLGVFGTVWLVIRLKWAKMPRDGNWLFIYGVSLIAGIGFTMSLFIGLLAYGEHNSHYPQLVRFGVFSGSLLSGLAGYLVLRKAKIDNNGFTRNYME